VTSFGEYIVSFSKMPGLQPGLTWTDMQAKFGVFQTDEGLRFTEQITNAEVRELVSCFSSREAQLVVYEAVRERQKRVVWSYNEASLTSWVSRVLQDGDPDPWITPGVPDERALLVVDAASASHSSVFKGRVRVVIFRLLEHLSRDLVLKDSVSLDQETIPIFWSLVFLVGSLEVTDAKSLLRKLASCRNLEEIAYRGFSFKRHVLRSLGGIADHTDLNFYTRLLKEPGFVALAFDVLGRIDPAKQDKRFMSVCVLQKVHPSDDEIHSIIASLVESSKHRTVQQFQYFKDILARIQSNYARHPDSARKIFRCLVQTLERRQDTPFVSVGLYYQSLLELAVGVPLELAARLVLSVRSPLESASEKLALNREDEYWLDGLLQDRTQKLYAKASISQIVSRLHTAEALG